MTAFFSVLDSSSSLYNSFIVINVHMTNKELERELIFRFLNQTYRIRVVIFYITDILLLSIPKSLPYRVSGMLLLSSFIFTRDVTL